MTVVPISLASLLLPGETARPVPTTSRYWVTDRGRVFSLVTGSPHEMSPAPNSRGYLQLCLFREPGSEHPHRWRPYVHELVALAFIGPRPASPGVTFEIDHINDVKTDNRVENLLYVTRQENMHRAIASGRHPAKLSEQAVYELRVRGADDEAAALAWAEETCGVQRQTARNALAGRTWAWVPFPVDGQEEPAGAVLSRAA